MNSLYKQLKAYRDGNAYPFHMPGHKRNMGNFGFEDPFSFDITEIEGFDNLHHAAGILKEAQERAARVYGAKETFFLVNGSTAGLLSAISGSVSQKGKLLMARNCHKAVYHAAFVKELDTVYLYPQAEPRYSLNGGIAPEDVKQNLEAHGDIQAVIITSPTYDGVVSDIRSIAKIVHSYGLPLIVDEAHGAHLKFHPEFPGSAVDLGADVVIQSVHKTLPSMTQTALLHICGEYADADRIRRYLSIYQSSSPSYVLMASIDRCMEFLEKDAVSGPMFGRFMTRLKDFRREAAVLKHLQIPGEEIVGTAAVAGLDISKIVISGADAGISGHEIDSFLRDKFQLEMEMAAGSYALALTSVMDSEEGFQRLLTALLALDEEIDSRHGGAADQEVHKDDGIGCGKLPVPEQVMPIYAAENGKRESIPLAETVGRISGEYVYLYPPGIPLAAPGERISEELMNAFMGYRQQGLSLEGMRDLSGERLQVLTEEV